MPASIRKPNFPYYELFPQTEATPKEQGANSIWARTLWEIEDWFGGGSGAFEIDWFIDLSTVAGTNGDGVNSDSAGIENAVTLAAASGKAILVRPGFDFVSGGTTINQPVYFLGFGSTGSRFRRLSTSTVPLFTVTSSNVAFDHIYFNNNLTSGHTIHYTGGDRQQILNCEFEYPSSVGVSHFVHYNNDIGSNAYIFNTFFKTSGTTNYAIGMSTDSFDNARQIMACRTAIAPFCDFANSRVTFVKDCPSLGQITFGTSVGRGHQITGNNFGGFTDINWNGNRSAFTNNVLFGINMNLTTATDRVLVTNNIFGTGVINNSGTNNTTAPNVMG